MLTVILVIYQVSDASIVQLRVVTSRHIPEAAIANGRSDKK
jgi:hypothetical protein